jgi:hypothetical protein
MELSMDKERISKWLNDAVVVAHELRGREPLCCSSTVTLPDDIAKSLLENGIIESNGEGKKMSFIVHFGEKNWCTVWVDTTPKEKWKTNINISFS